MSIDRITDPSELRFIDGDMNVEKFIYTLGLAGDIFFKGLMDGKILASKCKKCGVKYLPPRIYCEECFEKIDEFVEVDGDGFLSSYTVQYVKGNSEPIKEKIMWGIIKFRDVKGGMLHKIGEADDKEVFIGMLVKPVFKQIKEREGKITDILYFKPIE